ncbi:Hypothetical predicted protein [Pelobates cultripes]|uniref:Uncharacterized protein n=1 Tax=Pelobates cultripes TaxID=61616 RepID=A0AAD1W5F3_PELCU|nr:Hypothetical predicted protein [Pelobates cultripes]
MTVIYRELLQARDQLTELLRDHFRSVQHSKGFFYAHTNKGGQVLYGLLKGTLPRTQVHRLRLSTGQTSPFPNDIAEEFRSFYHSLYSLYKLNEVDVNRPTLIDNYLRTCYENRISYSGGGNGWSDQ